MSHLQLSQKIQLLTKDFQKSIDLLKTCIDGALGKMALSNFCNHEKKKKKIKEKFNIPFVFMLTKTLYEMDVAPEAISGWTNWAEKKRENK